MTRPSEAVSLPPEWVGFEYPIDGSWWEFAGWVDCGAGLYWKQGGYFWPVDRPHPRPDLPGLIFNFAELLPLTRAAKRAGQAGAEGTGTMTFVDVVMECFDNREFVAQWERLYGYKLTNYRPPRNAIEAMVDRAVGYEPFIDHEAARAFISFVHRVVWNTLPSEAFERVPATGGGGEGER